VMRGRVAPSRVGLLSSATESLLIAFSNRPMPCNEQRTIRPISSSFDSGTSYSPIRRQTLLRTHQRSLPSWWWPEHSWLPFALALALELSSVSSLVVSDEGNTIMTNVVDLVR
jgi:hypothetical protein